jgi:uncharacterized membrane protein
MSFPLAVRAMPSFVVWLPLRISDILRVVFPPLLPVVVICIFVFTASSLVLLFRTVKYGMPLAGDCRRGTHEHDHRYKQRGEACFYGAVFHGSFSFVLY